MAQRHLYDRETDAYALRAHCESRGERDRVRVDALTCKVVLGEPNAIEAQLFGERRLLELLEDGARVVLGGGGMRERQPAKFHALPPATSPGWSNCGWDVRARRPVEARLLDLPSPCNRTCASPIIRKRPARQANRRP
jgi:hypothetical protein